MQNQSGCSWVPNPLLSGNKFFLGENPKLELILTHGHTKHDTTLILTQGSTKTALTGDVIRHSNDTGDSNPYGGPYAQDLLDSRKKIFCQANYIIPGHGQMFTVTQQMKTDQNCTLP